MAGSMKKRGSNSWRLTVSAGYNGKGERIRHTKTIKATSKRKAEKELAKFVTEVEQGLHTNNMHITFKAFTELWLESKTSLAPKTKLSYISELENRILPMIGHIKLKDLTPITLQKFYNELNRAQRLDGKQGALSGRTMKYYYRIINTILNTAVKLRFINSNPNSVIESPKLQTKITSSYTESEIKQLLEALINEPIRYKTLICLILLTGLRRGEALALTWDDIDFSEKTLTVNKSAQYIPQEGVIIKQPKNDTSNRIISLSDNIIPILQEHKMKQQEKINLLQDIWGNKNYVFTQWNGEIMHPSTISNWFRKFIQKHKLPKITIHGLRHTSATLLISKGNDIRTIANRLGHANTSTTLNIYAHALKSKDREAADTINYLIK